MLGQSDVSLPFNCILAQYAMTFESQLALRVKLFEDITITIRGSDCAIYVENATFINASHYHEEALRNCECPDEIRCAIKRSFRNRKN